MTEKLYEADADLRTFAARVLACERDGETYAIVLDRTAFFAEGGGQPADHGTLRLDLQSKSEAGEGCVNVLDVHARGDSIVHTTDGPLPVGETVIGTVDDARRFMLTQQHSGEHIFSGLVHQLYGYDNVGFHMGTDAVTMDFNGMLTPEQALDVERRANGIIWADVPVEVFVPSPEELATIEYRSKKALTGDVRIVRIPGADCCACCGTHVHRTGAIGQVKVLSVQKYKGGVRVSILCGVRALAHENRQQEQLHRTAVLLSTKEDGVAAQVEALLAERDRLRYERDALAMKLFEAQTAGETGAVRLAVPELEPAPLRRAASLLAHGAQAALVLTRGEGCWNFALCSETMDIRPATKALCAAFGGKGGGSADMTQGRFLGGTPEEIRAALEAGVKA